MPDPIPVDPRHGGNLVDPEQDQPVAQPNTEPEADQEDDSEEEQ